jgi:hypothetical protein
MDGLVLSSIVVKPASSKLIYTPAIDGEIKATTLTIEDPFTEESINVKDTLDSKQNILIAGNNITIDGNTISSSGGITQEQLDGKQETLSLNSQLGIKSLIVTNDTFSSATNVAGQVKCDSLEIQPGLSTGGAIIGKCQIGNDDFGNMMSLSLPGNQTGTNYAFAQVDSFETIMNCQATNSGNSFRIRNVETARITNIGLSIAPNNGNRNPTQALDVLGNAVISGRLVITNTQPTLYLKDTNNRSGMIHMNSDRMYFLSGENNTESWTTVNGQWPLYLQTNTNEAVFGGTITTPSYTFSSGKPRFRIYRHNFGLPSGTTSLLNGGTIQFQSNVTLSSGIFIATITGVYCVTCKLRMPDNNGQSPEIQWYLRASNGTQTNYETFEMWIPNGVSGRRSGMTQCLVNLDVGQGILPRNDLNTMAGCTATFEGFLVQ